VPCTGVVRAEQRGLGLCNAKKKEGWSEEEPGGEEILAAGI